MKHSEAQLNYETIAVAQNQDMADCVRHFIVKQLVAKWHGEIHVTDPEISQSSTPSPTDLLESVDWNPDLIYAKHTVYWYYTYELHMYIIHTVTPYTYTSTGSILYWSVIEEDGRFSIASSRSCGHKEAGAELRLGQSH